MENSCWLEFTEAETRQKILVHVNQIQLIEEDEGVDNIPVTDIYVNGNRFIVNEKYEIVKQRIAEVIRN